nr:thiol-activated cytolysin family protein [uncultured Sphingobacterium sp.]
MKQIFKLFFAVPILLYSCNKESINYSDVTENINKSNLVQKRKWEWDKIYTIKDGKEIDITASSSAKLQGSVSKNNVEQFYEIATLAPNYIYLGSVLSSASINTGLYEPVGYASLLKPKITASFSLPVRSKEISPTRSSLNNAVIDAVGDRNFSGKQSQVFTYKMKQLEFYKEAKLAFGANVNIASVFNISAAVASGKIQRTSALVCDFSQIYFNIAMDVPDDGNIFKDEPTRQSFLFKDPVYVNMVNYGRKGVILVESVENYNELSVAVRTAFNAGIVNGSISLDTNTKRILTEAEISICIIGGDGQAAVRTVKGFDEFQNFIINGGVYTSEVYGVPISFGAAYAATNGMFQTEFEL